MVGKTESSMGTTSPRKENVLWLSCRSHVFINQNPKQNDSKRTLYEAQRLSQTQYTGFALVSLPSSPKDFLSIAGALLWKARTGNEEKAREKQSPQAVKLCFLLFPLRFWVPEQELVKSRNLHQEILLPLPLDAKGSDPLCIVFITFLLWEL